MKHELEVKKLDVEELEERIAPSATGNPGNNNPPLNNTNNPGNEGSMLLSTPAISPARQGVRRPA